MRMKVDKKRIQVFLLMLLGGILAVPTAFMCMVFLVAAMRGDRIMAGEMVVALVICPVLLILSSLSILMARRLEGHVDRADKREVVKWVLRISAVVGLLWSGNLPPA